MKKRTSLFENALLWFGAGISIAEILTGTYFSSLGIRKGLLAIFLGHLIGGALMFLAGLIGGKCRQSSMETVQNSFGPIGGAFFALCNILQLMGWTAIMIYDGALAAGGIFAVSHWIWCVLIGGLILLWILVGIQSLGKLNAVAMTALFLLTLVLCKVIFSGRHSAVPAGASLSFGSAVELAAAMPLSWLPLISDYTREAEKPVPATFVSVWTYTAVSCWMYGIGMFASLFTGEGDIAGMLLKAGLGIFGLLIVIFSTVTTTFLDAWSAGISGEAIYPPLPGKYLAIGTAVLGTAAAVFFPMDNISGFLYLIGSVFTPMVAIQIADFYLLRRTAVTRKQALRNLALWCAGFILYRLLMKTDLPLGCTLPDMAVTVLLAVAADTFGKKVKRRAV